MTPDRSQVMCQRILPPRCRWSGAAQCTAVKLLYQKKKWISKEKFPVLQKIFSPTLPANIFLAFFSPRGYHIEKLLLR